MEKLATSYMSSSLADNLLSESRYLSSCSLAVGPMRCI